MNIIQCSSFYYLTTLLTTYTKELLNLLQITLKIKNNRMVINMATLKLKLRNAETGKTETFTQNFVSGRVLFNAIELAAKFEEEKTSELQQLEEMIYLAVSIFNNDKITYDTILDGIAADELHTQLMDLFDEIFMTEEQKKMKKTNLEKVTK